MTLVELMMTVGIIAVVALIAAPLMVQTARFYLLTRSKVLIQRDARGVMETITKSLRQARSSTIVLDRFDASQPYYSRLRFTTVNNAAYAYYQQGLSLYQVKDGVTRRLSENMRFVTFYFPKSSDLSIISVSLTFEKSTYQGRSKALHVASERVRVMN